MALSASSPHLRRVDREQFGGHLPVLRHAADGLVDFERGDLVRADLRHHGGVPGCGADARGGNQVGDHRQGHQAQKKDQEGAYGLITAAKYIKHFGGVLLLQMRFKPNFLL